MIKPSDLVHKVLDSSDEQRHIEEYIDHILAHASRFPYVIGRPIMPWNQANVAIVLNKYRGDWDVTQGGHGQLAVFDLKESRPGPSDLVGGMIAAIGAFATFHGELPIAHVCTAAEGGEEWAIERIVAALRAIDSSFPNGGIAKSASLTVPTK